MAKVEIKAPIVDEIKGYADNACAAVLVSYHGLTVEQDTQLRRKLREAGVVYKVYKNTYMKRAFEGTAFAQLNDALNGGSAIAFSTDDATAPARVLADFMKTAPTLQFKAGVVEGVLYDEAGLQKLATIPSKEVLISKLLGSLQSPVANLARVIKQIAEKNGEAA